MQVLDDIATTRRKVFERRSRGAVIGLVPTMGALHAGHAALINNAARHCDIVVVSVFVNPTQFGPSEDFEKYPRTLDRDEALCRTAGAQLLFTPTVSEIYPTGFMSTFVEVPNLGETLCGASRPGHFRGVATVVLKLLNIVEPDTAFFGEKDFQQLLVIKRMVSDLNLAVEIHGVPTVRELDGLALSSRNRYLNPREREAALVLWRALEAARQSVRNGERDAGRVRHILRQTIESEPRAELEYAEVADALTLEPLKLLSPEHPARALLAVRVGPARLIDNASLALTELEDRGS